jgi:hypothetical protein
VPSYNALIQAAKGNHPEDSFLDALPVIPNSGGESGISVAELQALLGQLRIALESMRGETGWEESH